MEDKNRIILFRVLASVIDSAIIAAFHFISSYFIYIGSDWFTIIQDIFMTAYYIYFHAKFGQTPGKMILSIKVVDYKSGSALSLKQAVLRYSIWMGIILLEYVLRFTFGYDEYEGWITALPGLFALIVLLSIFSDDKGRGIHDKIAGTITKDVHSRKSTVDSASL
ncbi:MAG: RDD family protein [Bacteroidota bacterium]